MSDINTYLNANWELSSKKEKKKSRNRGEKGSLQESIKSLSNG